MPQGPRAALDSVFASPAYRWQDEPGPLRILREWWYRLGDWLTGLRADHPEVFRLLVSALLVLLLLILAHAAYVVWRTARDAGAVAKDGARAPREPRDADWYSREADRAAGEGRLRDALQLAFVALALTLEREGALDYHLSKTPAECAREARLAEPDRQRLRSLVRGLYGHVFGGRPLGRREYEEWREAGAPPWHAAAG